jgi:flavodoxin
MRALVVFKSYHHGNTRKVAAAIAQTLNAKQLALEGANPASLDGFDLVGFGSGIYAFSFHKDFFAFVKSLPKQGGKKAFVFSTSGSGKTSQNKGAIEALRAKGFDVIGDFSCMGFDTWGPFGLVGGMAKGHPDKNDLENAKKFAESLKDKA